MIIVFQIVARTFSDLAVIPITLPGNQPLRHYVSLISADVLAVGSSKEAKQVIQVFLHLIILFFMLGKKRFDNELLCTHFNNFQSKHTHC